MFTHPSTGSELARGRQRDMLASAGQQCLAGRSRAKSRTRRAARPGRRIRPALRAVAWPRTEPRA